MTVLSFQSVNVAVVVCDQSAITARMRPAIQAIEEGQSDREAWRVCLPDPQLDPKRRGR